MNKKTVLLADDDASIRIIVTRALEKADYNIKAYPNGAQLLETVQNGIGDIIITDVVMPDINGLDLIPKIHELRPDIPVIVISAQNTLSTAITAKTNGAIDCLAKPFDLKELIEIVDRNINIQKPAKQKLQDIDVIEQDTGLIGKSAAMQEIYRMIARLMGSDLSILIRGESGTGKEVIANAVHRFSPYKNGEFIAVNMAAIPHDLIESELFGHEKGAFTGAVNRKIGKFEQANKGSLFLDEIGDMPLSSQTRLLRVLQTGKFTRVGGNEEISTDIRIIAATHRNMEEMISQGKFREDLYYRLNVVTLKIPALKDRLTDIEDLSKYFINEKQSDKVISSEAFKALKQYHWPGNIRELKNVMDRLITLYPHKEIGADIILSEIDINQDNNVQKIEKNDSLPLSELVEQQLDIYFKAHAGELPSRGLYNRIMVEVEKPLIIKTLTATNGNQIKAAEVLGLNRNTLRKKITELGIDIIRK